MKGSYQFEDLEGREKEAGFLAERASMRLEGFPELLHRHGFPSQGKILELGCGQGIRTKMMSDFFPEAQVMGIDRSPELLQSAIQNRGNSSSPQYLEADLYHLPFAPESFDFVYARLVFMHLHEPLKALSEIFRVLRPGGRILIEDADRDCMFFEPSPPSFSDFWKKVQEGQRKLGGDPNVGRKIAPWMKQLGLKVQVEAQPLVGDGDDIRFLARTLLPSLNIYLDPQERPFGEKAIQDLHQMSQTEEATFYHLWFVVSGEKA